MNVPYFSAVRIIYMPFARTLLLCFCASMLNCSQCDAALKKYNSSSTLSAYGSLTHAPGITRSLPPLGPQYQNQQQHQHQQQQQQQQQGYSHNGHAGSYNESPYDNSPYDNAPYDDESPPKLYGVAENTHVPPSIYEAMGRPDPVNRPQHSRGVINLQRTPIGDLRASAPLSLQHYTHTCIYMYTHCTLHTHSRC